MPSVSDFVLSTDQIALLLEGALVTVRIGAIAALLALAIAIPAGLLRAQTSRLGRGLVICYIEFFRGTSLIVQLFWLYFVLPQFGLVDAVIQVTDEQPHAHGTRRLQG